MRLPGPLSQGYRDLIMSHHNRTRSSGSALRAKDHARRRIANFLDQYASCEGIQDGIDKTARGHQRCSDAVECQGDFRSAPDGQASRWKGQR